MHSFPLFQKHTQPEASRNVQKYGKEVYLRTAGAQQCNIHSTLLVPLFRDADCARTVGVLEVVQNTEDMQFGSLINALNRALKVGLVFVAVWGMFGHTQCHDVVQDTVSTVSLTLDRLTPDAYKLTCTCTMQHKLYNTHTNTHTYTQRFDLYTHDPGAPVLSGAPSQLSGEAPAGSPNGHGAVNSQHNGGTHAVHGLRDLGTLVCDNGDAVVTHVRLSLRM